MERQEIDAKMHALEEKIGYHFKNIQHLAKAMGAIKRAHAKDDGKNNKSYQNDAYATIGDALLKAVLSDILYKNGATTKKDITDKKKRLENNNTLSQVMDKMNLRQYTYNEKGFYSPNAPQHERVVSKKHDPYVESIVGAIYFDGGFNKLYRWIKEWLYPLLEQYKNEPEPQSN